MRASVLLATAALAVLPTPLQAATSDDAADRDGLRREWHRCVRQSFSGQPATLDKRVAERAALAQCKASEDAYVAAELAARRADEEAARQSGRGLTGRARAWVASVAAYVVDPVSAWFGSFGR